MIQTLEQVKASILKVPSANAPTELKIGDRVTYTNDYGVRFDGKEVIGFCEPRFDTANSVFLNKDAYWFPVPVSNLVRSIG